jgi:HEPN domain-containing protein/predicted nucleotidyltransferase
MDVKATHPPVIPAGYDKPVEETLPAVVERIVQELKPEKIVLFGSYARGEQTPDSDVDLLVIMQTDESHAERSRAVSRLIDPRPFPTDIVVRTPDEVQRAFDRKEFFVPHILSEGRVLYDTGRTWRVNNEERRGLSLPPDIAEWLHIAEEDLALARVALRRKHALPSGACFHAQQCVEKYLKAVLIAHGGQVIKTHNLQDLFHACVAAGAALRLNAADLKTLSDYAVRARYPGNELTVEQAQEAVRIAGKMRRTLRKALDL